MIPVMSILDRVDYMLVKFVTYQFDFCSPLSHTMYYVNASAESTMHNILFHYRRHLKLWKMFMDSCSSPRDPQSHKWWPTIIRKLLLSSGKLRITYSMLVLFIGSMFCPGNRNGPWLLRNTKSEGIFVFRIITWNSVSVRCLRFYNEPMSVSWHNYRNQNFPITDSNSATYSISEMYACTVDFNSWLSPSKEQTLVMTLILFPFFFFPRMASRVLLATLAIPIPVSLSETEKHLELDENAREKSRRLANLLGLQNIPTRASLINDMVRSYWHDVKVESIPLSLILDWNDIFSMTLYTVDFKY